MKSIDAISSIAEPLDFVYIDGNHKYEFIVEDIENYYKLLKPGGWLAGHDYCFRAKTPIDVKRAVDEFVLKTNLELHTSDGEFPDWWIQKPI